VLGYNSLESWAKRLRAAETRKLLIKFAIRVKAIEKKNVKTAQPTTKATK
jgi:hypothetical protein